MAKARARPTEVMPHGQWPMEMRAETAAAYCDEPSVDAFLEKVEQGIYSSPVGDDPPKWFLPKIHEERARHRIGKGAWDMPQRGVIYVIGFDQYIKIGFTESFDASRRIAEIQQGLPVELKVYMTFLGTVSDEKDFHRRFAHLRTRGEWFRLEGNLADWLFDNNGGNIA